MFDPHDDHWLVGLECLLTKSLIYIYIYTYKCHVCLGSYIQIREIEIRVAQNVARSELVEKSCWPNFKPFPVFFHGPKNVNNCSCFCCYSSRAHGPYQYSPTLEPGP